MGSESRHRNGDGFGGGEASATLPGLPPTAKKVVQRVKEIVNCSEQEIYAALKECDMDPNRAVERLLSQDTFHEVRSKRERRKEMKEASDSRTRVSHVGFSRGGKSGTQSALTHVTYNEQGKAADKREVGSIGISVPSSTTHAVGKSTKIDSSNSVNGRQSLGASDSISVFAQVSSGLQTSVLGVSKGHLSMADIVRMGRTSQSVVSHNHNDASGVFSSGISESGLSLHSQSHSQQVFHDGWPAIEQPISGNLQALNVFASSTVNGPSDHPNVHDTAVSLHRNYELDATQVSLREVADDNVTSDKIESASISSKHAIKSSNTGLGSHSSDYHCAHDEHNEDVSLVASDLQQLSMRESKLEVPSSEEKPAVVLPNHLQALAAECSHLSFGTYNGGSDPASAIPTSHLFRSGLEEKSVAVAGSSSHFLDARSVHLGNNQLGFDALSGTTVDKNNVFLSSQQNLVKHTLPEETLGHEYNSLASMSDPYLQKSNWAAPSPPLKQPGLQNGSNSSFPREMHADINSIPGDMLAFLMSQSQPPRYNNVVSSISNTANSMSEVMEPGIFALRNRSTLPQDLSVQSSIHFQQLPDTRGYSSFPQNQSYLETINSQQALYGNTAYNQSPVDMKYNLLQNKNEFLTSRLPPASDRGAFGYGSLGSSYRAGSFPSNQPLGYMTPSSNLDEILSSQYNGGRNFNSIQQPGNFSQWDYGAESRSSYVPERTQYNLLGQPSQASLSQFASPGYSDLYHSQMRVMDEPQRPSGFQDLSSSKQLHQFWQHSH